jgi:hypothetical protein
MPFLAAERSCRATRPRAASAAGEDAEDRVDRGHERRHSEKASPIAMPGRLITSGMIWWSRSMKVMTTSAAANAK